MAFETPFDDPDGFKIKILTYIDYVITAIFVLECVLKILVFGFIVNGRDSYLRNGWNCIDFFIVIVALISLTFSGVDLGFLRAMRTIRILRPLRVISRNQNLKKVVQSLINAIPDIFNVSVISFLFFMLFGILGINYFKGAFFSCVWPGDRSYEVVDKLDCTNFGGIWHNSNYSFDNVLKAMLTLFEMSTTEGWVSVMWSGVDAVGIEKEPVFEKQILWVLFFIFFIIVGSNFLLNLFVGVVINKFNQQKDIIEKDNLLSEDQKSWLNTVKLCATIKPARR